MWESWEWVVYEVSIHAPARGATVPASNAVLIGVFACDTENLDFNRYLLHQVLGQFALIPFAMRIANLPGKT